VRRHRKEGPVKRSLYFAFYRLLSLLSEIDIPLDAGDFCVMDRRVVQLLKRMPERQPFVRGLRTWVGLAQVALPYDRAPRAAGDPKYSAGRLMGLALDGLLSSSTLPLRLATYFGALMSAVAFAGVLLVLVIRLLPDLVGRIGIEPIPGVTTVAICVLLLGGVQLLCLGILGEYLGRIFENVKGRPLWTVRESLGIDEPESGEGWGLVRRGGAAARPVDPEG
jgi:dolichol-phosphate mannosyltransferase